MEAVKSAFSNFFYGIYLVFYVILIYNSISTFTKLSTLLSPLYSAVSVTFGIHSKKEVEICLTTRPEG